MKIIALQGKSNCGKTTTLKLLIKLFLKNNKFILDSKYVENEIISKCDSNKSDVKCVFIYGEIKIGITTRGDTKEALERDFKNHFSECDIVVCAIHTHGKTVEFIESIRSLSKYEKMYRLVGTGNPSSWQGGVWILSNYFVFKSLLRYGYKTEADKLALKTLDLLDKDLKKWCFSRIL